MDKYIQRTANPNWRPIVRKEIKKRKRQTTITSLSKVTSLDLVKNFKEDLAALSKMYDNGASLTSLVTKLPGEERQKALLRKKADACELEMSDFENEQEYISPVSIFASSSSSSTTTKPPPPTSIFGSSSSSSTTTKPPPPTSENKLEQRIISILRNLHTIHIALETLEMTGIGKVVKRLTKPTKPNKKIFPSTIVKEANKLVGKWRATAEEGLSRRKRRKASGVDDAVIPRWKKGKLDYHGFKGRNGHHLKRSNRTNDSSEKTTQPNSQRFIR
jgi:hypothetical protein